MNAFLRQCMNSYSNLGFFFFGMILLLSGISDHRNNNTQNPLTRFPVLSMLFGCCLVYLCFGSTFFHASLTWPGQRFDMNATYSVTIILFLLSLYRLLHARIETKRLKPIIVISFFSLVILFIYLHLAISSTFLLPFLMLIITIITSINFVRYNFQKKGFAILSLVCLVAAFVFRQLDVAKIACDPHSYWQGHSAWHVLIGASPFFLYLFYRSESTNNFK
jgi:hypothetical protein